MAVQHLKHLLHITTILGDESHTVGIVPKFILYKTVRGQPPRPTRGCPSTTQQAPAHTQDSAIKYTKQGAQLGAA